MHLPQSFCTFSTSMKSTIQDIITHYEQIAENDHLHRVNYYEENSALIFLLTTEKQSLFKFFYIQSLFSLGRYEKVLAEIDPLIEYVFLEEKNFSANTFEELIFIKAASSYDLHHYDQAINISKQLVSMNPENTLYQQLLLKCYRRDWKDRYSTIQLIAIVVVLGAMVITALTLLKGEKTSLLYTLVLSMNLGVLVMLSVAYGASRWHAQEKLAVHKESIRTKSQGEKEFVLEKEK